MIYIASPYSHIQHNVMEGRYEKVLKFTAEQLKSGVQVYSPIAHCHDMAKKYNMPKDFNFWQDYNIHMINLADEMYVLCLHGYEESHGVRAEIDYAQKLEIPITYMQEDGSYETYLP